MDSSPVPQARTSEFQWRKQVQTSVFQLRNRVVREKRLVAIIAVSLLCIGAMFVLTALSGADSQIKPTPGQTQDSQRSSSLDENPGSEQKGSADQPSPPPSGIGIKGRMESRLSALARIRSRPGQRPSQGPSGENVDAGSQQKSLDSIPRKKRRSKPVFQGGGDDHESGESKGAVMSFPSTEEIISRRMDNGPSFQQTEEHHKSRKQQVPDTEDQKKIKEMMKWAWKGYREFAWGMDALKPVSRSSEEQFGLGGTILDAIDTLYLMGLTEEYEQAREWIEKSLNFEVNRFDQVFETVIRCLGGLLSAYALTDDPMFLNKATDLGYRLLPSMESSGTGIPYRDVNLKTGQARSAGTCLAEVDSLQIEFKYLAAVSHEPRFAAAANKAMCAVYKNMPDDGLIPTTMDIMGRMSGPTSIGGGGDSHYEYVIKQWLLTGRQESILWDWYKLSMDSMNAKLIYQTKLGPYTCLASDPVRGSKVDHENGHMCHLECFAGGMLILGAHVAPESAEGMDSHVKTAEGITNTCMDMYRKMPTGLSPECVTIRSDIMAPSVGAGFNIQRPETIESLFYFARIRWDERGKYQEIGRAIYESFEKYMRVESGGYTSLSRVDVIPPPASDKMETFFLAETLKYLYLLFSDDQHFLHPAEHWVFNTEAHPVPSGLNPNDYSLAFDCSR